MRHNNRTQSVQWITNISIRRTQNCTKARHKLEDVPSNSISLSSKEALWRTIAHKLSQRTVHERRKSIVQHSGKTSWKLKKTITETPSPLKSFRNGARSRPGTLLQDAYSPKRKLIYASHRPRFRREWQFSYQVSPHWKWKKHIKSLIMVPQIDLCICKTMYCF